MIKVNTVIVATKRMGAHEQSNCIQHVPSPKETFLSIAALILSFIWHILEHTTLA